MMLVCFCWGAGGEQLREDFCAFEFSYLKQRELTSTIPPPGSQRGQNNFYNRSPSPNLAETFPPSPASKPRPAPRPPRMQPMPPKPQPRRTPSPNRPGSGGNARDQLLSPPAGDQVNKDTNRPDSAGRPPGLWQLYVSFTLATNNV